MKIKCPECRVKTEVLFNQIHGIAMVIEQDGVDYYQLQCSSCGWEWLANKNNVKKIAYRQGYDG